MPYLIRQCGVRVVIGKGGMGEETRKACAECGCVYLQTVGGAASLLAARIQGVESVHFLGEFGAAEALWELNVKDFEAVVTIDAAGRSLHKRIEARSRRALTDLLAGTNRGKRKKRRSRGCTARAGEGEKPRGSAG
jgi:fumarate hydratase class I